MHMSKDRKNVTVQAGDTPVSVGREGARAGPARSSTNDCPEFPASFQAEFLDLIKTGSDAGDPYRRRVSIQRTPPRKDQGTSHEEIDSDEVIEVDNSSIHTARKPDTKRRRVETPVKDTSAEMKELRDGMIRLGKSSKILVALVSKNPNTKVEIKKEIAIIGRNIEAMARKCAELESYSTQDRPKDENTRERGARKEIGCQTKDEPSYNNIPNLQKVTIGTQTLENFTGRSREEWKEEDVKKLRQRIDTEEEYCWGEMIEEFWPDQCFQTATIEVGSPLEVLEERDLVAMPIGEQEANMDTGLYELYRKSFKELTVEEDEKRKTQVVNQVTRSMIAGETKVKMRNIFRIYLANKEMEELWRAERGGH